MNDIARHIQNGGLIVLPTDTVYGIGCDPFNETAIAALYEAKKRPVDKSIPVLVSSIEKAYELGIITPSCEQLLQQYWPGPLTVVVKQNVLFPKNISNDGTVALRMPNNAQARAIITACGGALATTSANMSGHKPITTAAQAHELFDKSVVVIDGGTIQNGVPSTVVNCTVEPYTVLREGPLHL